MFSLYIEPSRFEIKSDRSYPNDPLAAYLPHPPPYTLHLALSMLNMCRAEYVLALEVITGKNLAVPSGRTPTGLYVLVTTPYGYWNTAIHLEIRATFECEPMLGRGELVGTVEMSLKELLAHDEQFGLTSIPGPEHGQPAPPAPNISLNNKTRSRARNVVIFGESGSGKSSVINAIAQKKLAKTSGDAAGCTSRHQRYKVNISGQEYALFDTIFWCIAYKAPEPVVPLFETTTYVYSTICRKKVPIVVVVTGLENEPVIGNWWNTYGKEFESLGMPFKDHACVTTLVEDTGASDDLIHRIAESRKGSAQTHCRELLGVGGCRQLVQIALL
ncbi:uncharacterized protein EDB91DRAFT_1081723 [Suillus paluster]|uniref:uncharacterized protein n=1 Tax=Suillus paluster TaxID=48578 RepID=UPI001B8602BA|nr:uncharacterized protein EDB91DRAFT_1081723 [Suillus paluster]KAG1741438.1 hypothetical protein EDB91DRAFT_1081723 [Suillus paluster]